MLADSDSRWKWGMLTARQLEPVEEIDPYLLDQANGPSLRQLVSAGVDPDVMARVTMPELVEVLAERPPEVLVISLPGGGVVAACRALASQWPAGRRPLLVSGYVGVVYEKFVEGALARAGTDVVLANCRQDADRLARLYTDLGLDPAVVVETRLPFLREPVVRPVERPFTVTFAGQPGVPWLQSDRAHLTERLVRHARAHPERVVNIKLRSAPGERVTHAEPYPYPTLLRRFAGRLPDNLHIMLGDMGEVLGGTDLLVTVSSTAALEAMSAGVATALLTDFGVNEQLGNAYFTGSGCLVGFDQVDAGAAPTVNPEWADRHGVRPLGPQLYRARISRLLGSEPPPIRQYHTMARSPAYLTRLLASYGLAPDGGPLIGHGTDRRAAARFVRRAVRSTARTAYRTGAAVVAPTLRKWGSL